MSSLGTASIDLVTNQRGMQQQLQSMGSTITNWARRLRSVILPIFAGITGFQAFRAAVAQEESIFRLEQAFGRLGVGIDDAMKRASEFANTLQAEIGMTGGDIMDLMRDIVQQLGLTGAELETTTRAAIGLARAYNMDQSTALRMLVRVMNDANYSMERYGIVMDESLSGQERFNALVRMGIAGLEEMEQDTGTFAGALRRLKTELQTLAENVLMPILPILTRIIQLIERMAFHLYASVIPAIQAFANQWWSVMSSMEGSVNRVFNPLINAFSRFGEAITQIALTIRVVIANAIDSATVQLLRFGVAIEELLNNMGINLFGEGWADQAKKDIDALLDDMENRAERILDEYTRQRKEFEEAIPSIIAPGGGGGGAGTRRNMTGSYRPEALNNALQLNMLNRGDMLEQQLKIMRAHLTELKEQHKLSRRGVQMLEEVRQAMRTFNLGFQ